MEGLAITPKFWQKKKVLITGHTGFKGAWLALWLKQLGADVVGFAQPPDTHPNLFESVRLGSTITSIFGDIRDLSIVQSVIQKHSPEVVFHLAAQSLVRKSYEEPIETFQTNVQGTVHVLEAVRKMPTARVVVIVTSDKCYEIRRSSGAFQEDDPVGGHDPYSSSKGCAELVTRAYRDSFFSLEGVVSVATARAGNVVGGGDWSKDRLIPDLIRAFCSGRPAMIRNPKSVRPWQFVLEPLSGYLMLAERLWSDGAQFTEAWNFGPKASDERPVSFLASELARLWGAGARWEVLEGTHVFETEVLRLNSAKAGARLGWRPRLELATALQWVAEWYRSFLSNPDMTALTSEQIERFQRAG